jgi:beta-lactamase regulating signal transducer with metallopeptidase domain
MKQFAEWLSPEILRAMGWALVHFLWEGLALAALLSVAMAWCRTARGRYALAVGTLALMVAGPVATYFVVRQLQAAAPSAAMATARLQSAAQKTVRGLSDTMTAPIPRQPVSPDALLWFVEAWMAGVLILSLRNVGGLVLVEQMRRRESKPVSAALLQKCAELQRKLRLDRAVRYCECLRLEAPAVIGWFRPVVLLPVTALTGLSEEQIAAVIAHELAHIKRLDCFVNLFQVAAETLLFYHPAVWWVSKRIRAERENCCDDAAIQVCGDALVYARALTTMAERGLAPSLAMALNRSPLEARVMRLLGMEKVGSGLRTAGIAAGILCLAGAIFAGNAILGTVKNSHAAQDVNTQSRPSDAPKETAKKAQEMTAEATRAVVRRLAHSMTSSMVSAVSPALQAIEMPSTREATPQDRQTQDQKPQGSYIESLKAQGLENLTVDEIVALKVQGVTADYVKGLRDLGLKPSVDEIISMKVQGVTADYVKGLMALGWKPSIDEIVSMKVQGITQEYAKGFNDLGLKPDIDELISLKVQGVTPEYIREMRANGVDGKADEFISMKVQGITPEYVKAIHDLGWNVGADELIALKVQGVTPEYIRDMRAAGVNGGADEFVGMKVQGVTPEYVKGLHDLGFKPNADEVVGMKVQGVSPEYIRDIRATGLNPDMDEIVGMKVQGVSAEYIKALQATGLKDLKADDYIAARVQGVTPEFVVEAQKHGFKDLTLEKLIELKHAEVF